MNYLIKYYKNICEELQLQIEEIEALLEAHPQNRGERRIAEKKAKKHKNAKFVGDGGKRRAAEKIEGKPPAKRERMSKDEMQLQESVNAISRLNKKLK